MSSDAIVRLKDDSKRLVEELKKLITLNPELHYLIFDLAEFVKGAFKKEITITMIDRTQAEQDELYKNDEKYKAKKFVSPHMVGAAVDIRSKTFTPEEIKRIEDYLNSKYNTSNVFKWTAKNHKVGDNAFHFHIQYQRKKK